MTLPRKMGPSESPDLFFTGDEGAHFGQRDLGEFPFGIHQNLGQTEQTHDDRDKPDPVHEFHAAKGETGQPPDGIHADHGQQKPKDAHHQRLDHRLAGQPHQEREPKGDQGEEFHRAKLQRHPGQRSGRQYQGDRGDRPADEGADSGDGEGGSRPPLLGHLVAVQAGDRRRSLSGNVEQDTGDGSPVLRAVEECGQHDDGARRAHLEGQRDQHRDTRHRTDPRQHTDHRSEHRSQEGKGEILGGQGDCKAHEQVLKSFHIAFPPTGQDWRESPGTPWEAARQGSSRTDGKSRHCPEGR